ncbi:MAG: ATP-binding protein [Thermoplasmata archaeon]|nr:ATP-binding protein [Thermoplasmata archaeon]
MPFEELLIREKYLDRIRPYYEMDTVKVIVGPRRAGKSVILEAVKNEIRADDKHKISINFEDMDYDFIKNASDLNSYVKERIDEGRYYLFFDEIQHVKHFEKAIASFKSKFNCSIFITGSNSELLSGDLSTLLVGRTKEFLIQPFTYSETKDYLKLTGRTLEESTFYNYLRMGGYPQRFQQPSESAVRGYLQDLFESILRKDLLRRRNERTLEKLRRVASFVLANSGSRFSAQNVVDYLNKAHKSDKYISLQTVYNYLEKMEKAFLIKGVKKYNIAGKEIMDSVAKYYALDNGMMFINTNSIDIRDTFFLETLVYQELISRGYEVYVGETYRSEVDFIAVKDGKKCFIQVTYLLADEKTIDREFGAFSPIRDNSPKFVLSLDRLDMSRDGIIHYNIIDYLEGKVDLILT